MQVDRKTVENLAKAWLAEARRIRSQALCDCGCGEPVSARIRFRQGHDAKLLARYRSQINAILAKGGRQA